MEEYAMACPRIFLADDHIMLIDTVRKLLEREFEIVGSHIDYERMGDASYRDSTAENPHMHIGK
jgi:hypothetical protein